MSVQSAYTSHYSTPQYAPSRRSKKEQQKIIKQIAIFFLLACGLGVLFVLVVIPGLVRLTSNSSTNTTVVDNTLPPQPPSLSAPALATSSANLPVSGFAEPGEQIIILDNGQQVAQADTGGDGSFRSSVTLTKGDNHLSLYAIDQKNQHSPNSSEYVVTYNDQPPKLDVSEPQDKQAIQGKNNQNLTIKGQTDKNVRVYLNSRLIFTHDDGSFTTLQMLQIGDNTLDLKATDQAGNITEKILTVSYHD